MKGILFKPWKIKEITGSPLGQEWQTRRVIKPQPSGSMTLLENGFAYDDTPAGRKRIICKPRYQVGEIVYIKEAWRAWIPEGNWIVRYKSDNTTKETSVTTDDLWSEDILTESNKWHSPLFMPAWAARYCIQITEVRAERLQEITEEDCAKEGCPQIQASTGLRIQWYKELWNSINKPPYNWANNPWVWVYTL